MIRSARRTVSLEITRECTVLVRAPLRMPKGEIDAFVTAHQAWVERQLAKRRSIPARPEPTAEEIAVLKAAFKSEAIADVVSLEEGRGMKKKMAKEMKVFVYITAVLRNSLTLMKIQYLENYVKIITAMRSLLREKHGSLKSPL